MGNPELYPEHLLLALLDQELPQQLVPDAAALRAEAEAALRGKPLDPGRAAAAAASARRVSRSARQGVRRGASALEDDYVSTEHLLLALDVVPRDELLGEDRRRSAAASASPRRIPRAPTRRSRSSAAT